MLCTTDDHILCNDETYYDYYSSWALPGFSTFLPLNFNSCIVLKVSNISMCIKKILCESVKMGLSRNLRNFYLCVLVFHAL